MDKLMHEWTSQLIENQLVTMADSVLCQYSQLLRNVGSDVSGIDQAVSIERETICVSQRLAHKKASSAVVADCNDDNKDSST